MSSTTHSIDSPGSNFSVAFSFAGGNTDLGVTKSQTFTYYGCAAAGIITSPAGTYTDLVTLALSATTTAGLVTTTTNGSLNVSITVNPECVFSTAPGAIAFAYTAFGSAVAANTTFGTKCTNLLPYSMALDATSGVVSGLNYTLALNTSGSGGSSPLGSTGTGVAQTFFVNGNMAAGQAGTCAGASCAASNTHTITVSY